MLLSCFVFSIIYTMPKKRKKMRRKEGERMEESVMNQDVATGVSDVS